MQQHQHDDPEAARAAIRRTALDYIEGWYDGDAERMRRSLHPQLVKRIARIDEDGGASRLEQMDAETLVGYTRAGYGTATPRDRLKKDVRILDLHGNAATVKIDATDWVDYLHLARIDGRWQIVNVLWEPHGPTETGGR